MSKGKGLTFTIFAVLGAITGYATYMASKSEFSDATVDKYDNMINKAKHVGTDIKRTYTSIGDKKEFTENAKNLGNNAKKLATSAKNLLKSATNDMYEYAKDNVKKSIYGATTEKKGTKKSNSSKKTSKKKTSKK